MPDTIEPPSAFEVWVLASGGGLSSAGAWGTDADLLGDNRSGVDSVRLMGANRAAIVTRAQSLVTGNTYYAEAWVKASSVAANTEVKLIAHVATSINADSIDYTQYVLRSDVLEAADTWQRLSGTFDLVGTQQVLRLSVSKGSASFTVHVAEMDVWDVHQPTSKFSFVARTAEINEDCYLIVPGEVVLLVGGGLSILGDGSTYTPGTLRVID